MFVTTPPSSAPKSIESVTLGPTHVLIVPVVVLGPGSAFDPVVTDLEFDFFTSFPFL